MGVIVEARGGGIVPLVSSSALIPFGSHLSLSVQYVSQLQDPLAFPPSSLLMHPRSSALGSLPPPPETPGGEESSTSMVVMRLNQVSMSVPPTIDVNGGGGAICLLLSLPSLLIIQLISRARKDFDSFWQHGPTSASSTPRPSCPRFPRANVPFLSQFCILMRPLNVLCSPVPRHTLTLLHIGSRPNLRCSGTPARPITLQDHPSVQQRWSRRKNVP